MMAKRKIEDEYFKTVERWNFSVILVINTMI